MKEEIHVSQDDIKYNRWKCVFAYLGILVLIPMLNMKISRFAKFHANQGLVIFLGEVLLLLLNYVVKYTVWFSLESLGVLWILDLLFATVELLLGMLCIAGIYYVMKGRCVSLPVVGRIQVIRSK